MKLEKMKLLGGGGLIFLTTFSVVSCSHNSTNKNTISEENDNLLNLGLHLNENGKQKTLNQFYDEYVVSGTLVLEKYTNWNSIVSIASTNKVNIVFDSLTIKENVIDVKCKINNEYDSFVLIGFKTNQEMLDDCVNKFNLVASEKSVIFTSEEIYNAYIKDTSENKNLLFINNFELTNEESALYVGLNNNNLIYKENKYNQEINVQIESVKWNNDEIDNDIKGTKITVNFVFEYTDSLNNKKYTVNKNMQISGFLSYQQKFDNLIEDFEKTVIVAKNNQEYNEEKLTPSIVIEQFNSSSTYEEKFEILNKNTTINSINVFNNKSGQESLAIIDGVSLDKNDDTALYIDCSFVWNKIIKKGIKLRITQFKSTSDYINNINDVLSQTSFKLTNQGINVSSTYVVSEFKIDPDTIWKYINRNDLPHLVGVNIVIDSVISNDGQDVPTKQKGTTLIIKGKYIYNDKEYSIYFQPVKGFKSLYSIVENDFIKKVNSINLQLTTEAKKELPSKVNSDNWKKYVTNIPEDNIENYISNLSFNGSNDDTGELAVSFEYNHIFHDVIITHKISQNLNGMQTNTELATQNYDQLSKKMEKSNFMDTIIKAGEKKSDYFSSYFGSNNTTFNALKELFNFPILHGISISLNDLKYSKNDRSLSDTQLKVDLKITNTYTKKSFNKRYIIDGFMDPFNFGNTYLGTIRNMISYNGKQTIKFNNPDVKKWWDVPNSWKASIPASWQNGWLWEGSGYGWGYNEPYTWFRNNDSHKWINNSANGMNAKQTAINIITNVLTNSNMKFTLSNWSLNNKTYGQVRTGYKDDGGIIRGDITCSITFRTQAYDKKNHLANYNEITVDNVYVFIYFKDDFWKK